MPPSGRSSQRTGCGFGCFFHYPLVRHDPLGGGLRHLVAGRTRPFRRCLNHASHRRLVGVLAAFPDPPQRGRSVRTDDCFVAAHGSPRQAPSSEAGTRSSGGATPHLRRTRLRAAVADGRRASVRGVLAALRARLHHIVTSNLPFEDWTSALVSERLTGALLDRLTHHVHILTMNGDSYRLRQSAGRRRAAAARAEQNHATAKTVDPDTGDITDP